MFVTALVTSCGESVSAYDMIREFSAAYGEIGTVYSPSVPEGERGFVREGLFESLYGDYLGSVSDYAVILHSDGVRISECAVMVAVSEYDALLLSDALFERIELIRTVAEDDSSLDGAFVRRRGRLVVMCAVDDNGRAARIFDKLM